MLSADSDWRSAGLLSELHDRACVMRSSAQLLYDLVVGRPAADAIIGPGSKSLSNVVRALRGCNQQNVGASTLLAAPDFAAEIDSIRVLESALHDDNRKEEYTHCGSCLSSGIRCDPVKSGDLQ